MGPRGQIIITVLSLFSVFTYCTVATVFDLFQMWSRFVMRAHFYVADADDIRRCEDVTYLAIKTRL